ncbi:Ig-like domain-containing protein [Heyndrickxia sporothermodurans]
MQKIMLKPRLYLTLILASFMLFAQLTFTGLFVKAEELGTLEETNSFVNDNELENAYKTASEFMKQNAPTPTFEKEWYIFSLARGGASNVESYFDTYYKNLEEAVKSKKGVLHRSKYTEYSRVIIALNAIGKDPTNVGGYNLVEPLFDFDKVKVQGINGPIFALIALDTNHYRIPVNAKNSRQTMIEYILNERLEDGGWALGSKTSDPDITAMAIQALSSYLDQERVRNAVEEAVATLSKTQSEDGGFKSWGTANVESASQVVVALTSLGIDPKNDPRFMKQNGNLLSNIMTFYSKEDGGFKHVISGKVDSMATEQVSYAIASYLRFLNQQTKLYDMTDKKSIIPLSVNSVTSKSKEISGTTDAGASVTAEANNEVIGYTTANSNGAYSIDISPQNANTIINVFAEGGNKITSKKVISVSGETGQPDPNPTTPTDLVVNPVNDKSTEITGTAEAGADVELYIDEKLIQSTKADSNGKYSFAITPLKAGAKVTVKAIRSSGKSDSKTVTVEDKTPPALTINPVSDKSTVVTGTTEAGAKVELYLNNQLIQSKTADSQGNYSFTISKQKAGVTVKVTAIDSAGNRETKTVIVEDKTPPSLAINQVTDKSTKVTGKTEAKATVKLYVNGKLQQTKIASANGSYSFTIKKQKAGTKIKISVSDKAGNVASKTITVVDRTSPSLTINQITDKSTKVTGKTEAKATVKLYVNGKLQQTKTANTKGSYTFTIKKPKAGAKIKVTAADKAKNITTKTTIVIDKTAPKKPTVKKVTVSAKLIQGKAEAHSTVYVYKGKTKIGSAKANSKGIYKVTIKKQAAGTKLTIFTKDKAGNKSKTTSIKVSKK